MAKSGKTNSSEVFGLVVFLGLAAALLAGCGDGGDSTPESSLPDISEPESVVQTGPTPVVLSLVYQDDFTDQASGWDDAFDELTLKQYGAHKYHIEVNAPNMFAWGLANRDIADFVLEVTTKQWEGPTNNSYGVVFRFQDKGNFYRFDVTGDGFFLLSKFVDGEWLTLIDWTQSPAINTGQSENDLRVSALGSEISVYANGQLLGEAEDESFRHGDIGFFAGTFDESDVHISFDDLLVWAPPASEMVLRVTPTTTTSEPPRPTSTAERIALGQPTATHTSESGAVATITSAATVTQPLSTATVTQTASSAQATEEPGLLPGYVSAVQPKPRDASTLEGRIAYPVFDQDRGTYDVYVVEAAGGQPKLVEEDASQPCLSADGRRVAYRSWDQENRGLAARRLASTKAETLVKQDEAARPIWGPSGETLFFHSRVESDRSPRLYRVGEAETVEVLTDSGDAIRGETPSLLGEDSLVYKGCSGDDCGLMIVSVDGGEPRQLSDDLSDSAPAGSPDGEQIAFMRRKSGNWDIYTMSSDGTGIESLTPDASNEGLPTWSPDGRSIAFLSDRNGTWGLWVMDADGSNQYQLMQLGGSPDGKVRWAQAFTSVGWTEEQISWAP